MHDATGLLYGYHIFFYIYTYEANYSATCHKKYFIGFLWDSESYSPENTHEHPDNHHLSFY